MKNAKNTISFMFQLFLIVACYYAFQRYLNDNQNTENLLSADLIIILSAWFVTAWLTHKFKPQYYQRKWIYVIAPFLKAAISNLLFIFLFSYLFFEPFFNNGFLYKVSLIYSIIEILVYSIIIFVYRLTKDQSKSEKRQTSKYIQDELDTGDFINSQLDYLAIAAKSIYFTEDITHTLYPDDKGIKTDHKCDYEIIKSLDNLHGEEKKCPVYILDIRINDLKDINKAISSVYKATIPGGYLLAVYKNIDDFEKEYLISKFRSVRAIKTVIYFLYYRAFPKIPYLNVIYNLISGGHNKIISKAETWGRLFYNGYDVEKQVIQNGLSYIIARKTKTPSDNPAPSFYPIIQLNRVGLYGQIIQIHKIRSMYPYSEFLQKKVFEEGALSGNGKFENDFRITQLGKIYRKYWIDEIPQLIDWFRGKIKLVGIRAMSQHFFSLYPQEYKDLYFQVKPGIISPIFDENTDGFKDIVRIEQAYLESFLKNPIRTDFKYFFITLKHMLKGVRSK